VVEGSFIGTCSPRAAGLCGYRAYLEIRIRASAGQPVLVPEKVRYGPV